MKIYTDILVLIFVDLVIFKSAEGVFPVLQPNTMQVIMVDGTKFVGDVDPCFSRTSCPKWLKHTHKPSNFFEMNVFIRTASKLHISAIIYRPHIGRSLLFNPALHGPKKAYISVRVENKVEQFKASSFKKFEEKDHLYNDTNLPRKNYIYVSVPKGSFYVSGLVDKTILQWITNKCKIN